MLKPGDRVLDIGANVGMIALHAARLVGSTGRIDCFEPNPVCVSALEDVVSRNAIEHIHIHPFGLSDQEEVLELVQDHAHTGIATFGHRNPEEIVKVTEVQVRRGDDVFDADETPAKLIKIDVEGFELRAVKGLERTLQAWRPMILMEMVDAHLRRAGTSTRELGEYMLGLGFEASGVSTKKSLYRHRLDLLPIRDLNELGKFSDILWRPA